MVVTIVMIEKTIPDTEVIIPAQLSPEIFLSLPFERTAKMMDKLPKTIGKYIVHKVTSARIPITREAVAKALAFRGGYAELLD